MKLDREKVMRFREREGYSMALLAKEGGMAKNTIIRAENERDIRPSSARKLAAVLGVKVSDLVREPD